MAPPLGSAIWSAQLICIIDHAQILHSWTQKLRLARLSGKLGQFSRKFEIPRLFRQEMYSCLACLSFWVQPRYINSTTTTGRPIESQNWQSRLSLSWPLKLVSEGRKATYILVLLWVRANPRPLYFLGTPIFIGWSGLGFTLTQSRTKIHLAVSPSLTNLGSQELEFQDYHSRPPMDPGWVRLWG